MERHQNRFGKDWSMNGPNECPYCSRENCDSNCMDNVNEPLDPMDDYIGSGDQGGW